MPVTLVQADWSSGNLRFLDSSGNVIGTWDSANRSLTLASGATLDLSAATGILSLAAGEIAAADLASSAVTTAKIAATAVTTAKIAAGAVTTTELGAGAVTVAKLDTNLKLGTIHLPLASLREIASNDIPNTAADGGVLSSDTTPTYARVNGATDKALRVVWAASNVDEVQFPPVAMPPDLDAATAVTIHLVAKMAGATDTPTIDVQVFDGIGDTEMGGATGALSASLQELIVTIAAADIAGNPTGFLNIALVPAAHTTDALELYAAWIEYTRA